MHRRCIRCEAFRCLENGGTRHVELSIGGANVGQLKDPVSERRLWVTRASRRCRYRAGRLLCSRCSNRRFGIKFSMATATIEIDERVATALRAQAEAHQLQLKLFLERIAGTRLPPLLPLPVTEEDWNRMFDRVSSGFPPSQSTSPAPIFIATTTDGFPVGRQEREGDRLRLTLIAI